jgi:predicted MFS family arabinose efflux permease
MKRRWWCLAALTSARAAIGFQFQSVAAVGPLVSSDLGMDKAQFGWLVGLYLLPGVVFALPGGLLGQRYGDKRLVLIGLALMAAGGAWLALAGSFAEATAARFLSGIGAVMLNVLVAKMVADWFDGNERLLAMSVLINSWPVGIGLALLAAAPLGQLAGWPWAIASSALFAAIGFVIVLVIYQAPTPSAAEAAPTRVGLGVLTRREWRLLLIGSLPWLLYNAAFQIVTSFLPSFFVGSGYGIAHSSSLVALTTVFFVVGVQAGGVWLKHARHPDLICHAAIAGWCATLLFVAAGSTPWPWLVLGGVVGGLPAAALISVPAEFLRAESRGAGMGVFFTVYYLGCAILPGLAGKLYDLGGGGAALAMAIVIALGGALCLRLFRSAMTRPGAADLTGSTA